MNVESFHEDNDNKEEENKVENIEDNNEPKIEKRNSNTIVDENKKLKTVNEEITYEENTNNENKESNQVIDEPIHEEEKEVNNNPIEEENKETDNNNKEHTAQEIKERNKIVDTYLEELDKKDVVKKEEPILSSNQDEPDEFEKADAEYRKKKEEEEKKSILNQEEEQPQIEEHQIEETQNNNEQSNNQSPPNEENSKSISRNHQYSTVRSNSLIHQRRPFRPIIYKRPEDLYIKEIEHYKRIQMIKKMNGKVDFNVSKKIRQSEINNVNQEEENTDEENTKNELNQSDMIKYINTKNANKSNSRYYLSQKPKPNIKQLRERYEQKILRILNDKANPYSNSWTNQILASRYQVNLKVNGFLNGVPQFKIKKLKDCELPNIYYPSSTKVSKYRTSQRMSYENKQKGNIQFPLILRFFGENKDEEKNNNI